MLALAIGLAVGSAAVFGVSVALGAFLAGMVVGSSDYSLRAATDALPMRDAFAVLFFVSVGMLLRPSALLEQPAFVVTALVIVLVCNPAIALVVARLTGYPIRTGVTVAVSLAQIGEFSFILATLGRDLGIAPAEAVDVIVATAIVSITLNPLAFAAIAPIDRWITKKRATMVASPEEVLLGASSSLDPDSRAIVIGYGPTGRTVTRLLRRTASRPPLWT